jgi:hypothetical protein
MSVFSLFLSPAMAAYMGDVDNPEDAEAIIKKLGVSSGGTKFCMLYSKSIELDMATSDTKTVTWPNDGTTEVNEWKVCVARVVGNVTLSQPGTDPYLASATTTYMPLYGVAKYPAIGVLSAYGLSSTMTVTAAAASTVKLYMFIACLSTDSRYSTNA